MTVNTPEFEAEADDGGVGGYGGRIRRGPMAADAHFTQISNALFRDPRVSFKAKGIFGLISTHRNGFGITPEAIARSGKEGVAAIKTALQELEAFGYLDRTQYRRQDGTMGSVEYFITDMPRSEPVDDFRPPVATSVNRQNRRSEPVGDYPPADEPLAVNRRHKNTNSKHTSFEEHSLPSDASDGNAPAPAAAPVETRETIAEAIKDDCAKVVDAWLAARGGRRNVRAETRVRESAASLLAVGRSLADVIAIAEDMAVKYPTGSDLTIHDDHWSAAKTNAPAVLPKWCGCGGNPAAEFNGRFRTHDGTVHGQPCFICHPDAMEATA